MRYHILKPIRISGIGAIRAGREVELCDSVAKLYKLGVDIEAVGARELRENPVPPAGEPLSASPVGLVSARQTLSESENGETRKRGRPKKQ